MVRVQLCAIAKDEGAYLVDWVFHHLHVGFDGIAVWVNGTSDCSIQILEAIAAVHPQVRFRVVDDLLERALGRGKSFQHAAYERLARGAARQGFTHAAFLDLDEYWTPADLRGRIHDFVPADAETSVVSFPWCVDLPEPGRPAFTHPLTPPARLQRDVHVKSVVRLDERVRQIRTHTARIRSGRRLLVREPFPMVDERDQQWGSVTPDDHLAENSGALPEAFVLHALHRSPVEYVASLAAGLRQTGVDQPFKTNRRGFVASPAPMLELAADGAWRAYESARRAFHASVGVEDLVRACEEATVERADRLRALVRADPAALAALRVPLRGIADPELDRSQPGWDAGLQLNVDAIHPGETGPLVVGWAFATRAGDRISLALVDPTGAEWSEFVSRPVARPDVARVHAEAPPDSGFRVEVPAPLADRLGTCVLQARALGTDAVQRVPLRRVPRLG